LKVKLTPLNIVSAFCLVAGILMLWGGRKPVRPQVADMSGMLAGFGFLSAVIFFISDLIFRKFVPDLGKLWLIEGVLVIFMVILLFILKSA